MPLHTNYRVDDLDDMIGNKAVIKTLKSILNRDLKDLPHVWLFTGPGGSGKSTLARIVAKKLGCDPSLNNQDFQQINASSKGGIDTTREIETGMQYHPMNKNSKCRIYLLEEVQGSSKAFREALLDKCFEFTPPHVHFILCTTEPEKLGKSNGPFRRRCHTFETKKLKTDEMHLLMNRVIESEGVKEYFNDDIINAIADEADGSAGSALNILDKVIDLDTEDMLDAIKLSEQVTKQGFELAQKLLNGNWNDVRKIIYDAKSNEFLLNGEPESIRRVINSYMTKVVLKQSNTDSDTFKRALLILMCFENPIFNNGMPGLVKYCADVFS